MTNNHKKVTNCTSNQGNPKEKSDERIPFAIIIFVKSKIGQYKVLVRKDMKKWVLCILTQET